MHVNELKNTITSINPYKADKGTTHSDYEQFEYKQYIKAIEKIINKRNKIAEFLDGSNILISVMHPQIIREFTKELRHEIREIKTKYNISEEDIIKYLEEELINESRREEEEIDELPF